MLGNFLRRSDIIQRAGIGAAPTDYAARLPAEAYDKLRGLRARSEDARTLRRERGLQLQDKRDQRRAVADRLRQTQEAPRSSGRQVGSSHSTFLGGGSDAMAPAGRIIEPVPVRVNVEGAIRAMEAELAAMDRDIAEADALLKAIPVEEGELVRNLERYLQSVSHGLIPAASAKERPKPAKVNGGGVVGTVETIRAEIVGLRNDILGVRSAPYPSKMVKQNVVAQIEQLAKQGQPDLLAAVELGQGARFPGFDIRQPLAFGQQPGGMRDDQMFNALAFVCYLFRDHIIEMFVAEVDALADDKGSLTPEQRVVEIAGIKSRILELERQEELVIEQDEQILRRVDADPRAVLGLSSELPEPVEW